MKRSILILLIFVATLLASCSSEEDYPLSTLDEWYCLSKPDQKGYLLHQHSLDNLIEARTFTLNTPAGWTLRTDQGIDTYVGRIGGPEGDTIYFDQGFLSFKSLNDVERDDQTRYFRRLIVDGVPAIIEKEDRTNDTGAVRLTIYLDAGDQQRMNRLYVFDPKNEALILRIFKTHRFL